MYPIKQTGFAAPTSIYSRQRTSHETTARRALFWMGEHPTDLKKLKEPRGDSAAARNEDKRGQSSQGRPGSAGSQGRSRSGGNARTRWFVPREAEENQVPPEPRHRRSLPGGPRGL